jgi:UDP-N-acetylenolpyruvoylglucosamine reductase
MNASVRLLEPLRAHTALRTGGACDVWVVVHDLPALVQVVTECKGAGWRWSVLGAGTRCVYRDGGVSGAIIRLGTGFSDARFDGTSVLVGAGVPVAALCGMAASRGLAGIEGMAAVPGSVGASIVHDEGWAKVLMSVTIFRRGQAVDVAPSDVGPKTMVLGATLGLTPERAAVVHHGVRKALQRRTSGWFDGKRDKVRGILADVSVPGTRLRQVAIPEHAPELLINLGGGTARDLQLLHRSVLARLKRERGITLGSTVRWAGTGGSE